MTQVQQDKIKGISRVAKRPIPIPSGVTVTLDGQTINVKGAKGELSYVLHHSVSAQLTDLEGVQTLTVSPKASVSDANMHAGTSRALCYNMVKGVSTGFEKKLTMIGVGYRAQLQGTKLVLTVGKSHPDIFVLPEGISAELPSQTEIIIRGTDKQAVGQAAAKIRDFRPPEPYKGKGIRYHDEHVRRKEAKK